MPVVDHLIGRDGIPPLRGNAYDYVVAGDGLFVHASNRLLEVRVPVAACEVRGLGHWALRAHSCTGRFRTHSGTPCSGSFARLTEVVASCSWECASLDCGYDLVLPEQSVAPLAVEYTTEEDLMLEIHSHSGGAARFSGTDDADEQRLRLYGVVGKLDDLRPAINLRAGPYGHILPVPWSAVFAVTRAM